MCSSQRTCLLAFFIDSQGSKPEGRSQMAVRAKLLAFLLVPCANWRINNSRDYQSSWLRMREYNKMMEFTLIFGTFADIWGLNSL